MDIIFSFSAYALKKSPVSDSLEVNPQAIVNIEGDRVTNFLCSLVPEIEKQAKNFNLDVFLFLLTFMY